ncbi:MAG: aminotransferase class IV [Verrucomicrobiales bacterium]
MSDQTPGENPILWLNGRLLAAADAHISPFDRGFTVGQGAFETLVTYQRRAFAVGRHWRRLRRSCEGIGLPVPEEAIVRRAMEEVVRANGFPEARLRITVTVGEDSRVARNEPHQGTLLVTCTPRSRWPPTACLVTVPWPRNEKGALAGLKTTSYAENVAALSHAKSQGADEALFLNTQGFLCEGTGSNIFLVKGESLYTPPLSSGCLAGVTRELVLELAQQAGLRSYENDLDHSAIMNSDEAFLTSTTREIHPVAAIDGQLLPQPPGEITRGIREAWRRLVESDNGDGIL